MLSCMDFHIVPSFHILVVIFELPWDQYRFQGDFGSTAL